MGVGAKGDAEGAGAVAADGRARVGSMGNCDVETGPVVGELLADADADAGAQGLAGRADGGSAGDGTAGEGSWASTSGAFARDDWRRALFAAFFLRLGLGWSPSAGCW